MFTLKALALCLFAGLIPPPVVGPAPTMSVSPSMLTVGGVAVITYHNPALAGSEVTIEISDGSLPVPNTAQVKILLDANGNGIGTWLVPTWENALFNAPDVPEVSRLILRQ